jgi:hypothetical protein
VKAAPQHGIRRMTQPEEVAYAQGSRDAEEGQPLATRSHGFKTHDEMSAYERGYYNYAGEAVNG